MLCTFTIRDENADDPRTLVIRTDDIRAIRDRNTPDSRTQLTYLVGDERFEEWITGTARENKERLQREELETIAAMYGHQQQQQARLQQNLPIPPVARGRAGRG